MKILILSTLIYDFIIDKKINRTSVEIHSTGEINYGTVSGEIEKIS